MQIGIPRGYFYYTYRPFVETFFDELNMTVEVSKETDAQLMEKGIASCVDEACLPVKVFHGHVKSLAEKCDAVLVPRLMKTEFGESICPKVAGMPDTLTGETKMIFTEPLYLNDEKSVKKALWRSCKPLGIDKKRFEQSFVKGIEAQRQAKIGMDENQYKYKVFLAGHAYNVYDPFINLNIIDKLHEMDIGIVTEECVDRQKKDNALRYSDLMKKPYWTFFVNLFGSVEALRDQGINGIIYLSSFSCGTDSFTIEMIKNNLAGLPFLALKLDEQRGEAGFDTRLEAFWEVIKRKN